jgi:hypothetical protein
MMTWYVAYSPLRVPGSKLGVGERLEEFAGEAAAKEFAKKKAIDPKMRTRAGTLPGVIPSTQIEPAKIREWLKI